MRNGGEGGERRKLAGRKGGIGRHGGRDGIWLVKMMKEVLGKRKMKYWEREREREKWEFEPDRTRQKHAGNTIMRFPLQENVFVV